MKQDSSITKAMTAAQEDKAIVQREQRLVLMSVGLLPNQCRNTVVAQG